MYLWIRTQNKMSLLLTSDLRIQQLNEEYFDLLPGETPREGWHIVSNDEPVIGTYKTKERALEVLDEIQELLMSRIHERHINKFDIYNGDTHKVYQMPKE